MSSLTTARQPLTSKLVCVVLMCCSRESPDTSALPCLSALTLSPDRIWDNVSCFCCGSVGCSCSSGSSKGPGAAHVCLISSISSKTRDLTKHSTERMVMKEGRWLCYQGWWWDRKCRSVCLAALLSSVLQFLLFAWTFFFWFLKFIKLMKKNKKLYFLFKGNVVFY